MRVVECIGFTESRDLVEENAIDEEVQQEDTGLCFVHLFFSFSFSFVWFLVCTCPLTSCSRQVFFLFQRRCYDDSNLSGGKSNHIQIRESRGLGSHYFKE